MFSPIGPRWRKVLRDLWQSKTRSVLVVLSIAVGVFAVGTIVSTRVMLSQDLAASYAGTRPAGAILFTRPFDEDLVRAVRRMDGVGAAEGRARAGVRLQVRGDDWRDLRLEVLPNYGDIQIGRMRLERGIWPPPKREILLERGSFALLARQVGDTLVVETPNGKQHELRLAGVTHDLNKPPAAFVSWLQGYTTFDTLEWLGFPIQRRMTELHVVVGERPTDKAYVQSVADRVKHKVEQSGRLVSFVHVPPPGEHPATQQVETFLLILGALGGLSLFLSVFLVVNTVTALLAQQVPQIGIMKAIGARGRQVTAMYLGMVLLYGLVALALAVPLGAGAAYAFTSYLASLINFDVAGFRLPLQTLALQAAIALLVPLLAALWPTVAGTRVTVREAISTYGLTKGSFGAGRIDRLVQRVRVFPRPLLLSLRNTVRRKARLALTLFTLTLGGAIFIAVLSVHASLLATLDDALAYRQYDVSVRFSQPQRIEQVVHEAKQVPGVVAAESWRFGTARRLRAGDHEGPDIQLIAPPAETVLIRPVVLEGRWLLPGDEDALVINTEVLREEPDLKVGQEVTLKIDGRETTWRIVGLVRAVIAGPIAYANFPYFARVVHAVARTNGVQVVSERHDAASQTAIAAALKEHFDGVRMRVSSTLTASAQRRNIEYQFNILVTFLAIMALLLAVVGGLGLMGTMSINVLERSREIGVMRAIGASNRSVLQIFMVEGLLIGTLSWLIGAVLSLPISKLLSDYIGIAFMRAPLSYTFSPQGAFLWLGIVLVLAALASFLPSWRAARLTVREVLAYE